MAFTTYDLVTSHLDTTGGEPLDCTITCNGSSSNFNSRDDGGKCCGTCTDCSACTAWSNCGNPSEIPIETETDLALEISELRSALLLELA